MIFSKKRQPEDIHEWLVMTTKSLAHNERQRIWREVLTHFEDAVSAHQSTGTSEDSARLLALKEMGDTHEAEKAFRKKYLTQRQAKWIVQLLDHRQRLQLDLIFGFAGSILIICLACAIRETQNLHWKVTISTTMLALLAAPHLIRNFFSKGQTECQKLRWLIVCESLRVYLVSGGGAASWLFLSGRAIPAWGAFTVYCLFIIAVALNLFYAIKLSRKVRPEWLKTASA